jgi:hypothetical protein
VTQQQELLRRKRLRHWSRRTVIPFAILSVYTLGFGALFFWVGTLPGVGQSGGLYFDGLGAFFTAWGLALMARASLPVLVLTTHTLRRPRLFRRAQITPLDQVTGVGLVYRGRPPGMYTPFGWFLFVWTTGDIPRDLGIAYRPRIWLNPPDKVREKLLALEPSVAEPSRQVDFDHFSLNLGPATRMDPSRFNPVTQADPDKVAATHAGRVAREIYDRVLAYQGPAGYLATSEDQKHVPANYGFSAASVQPFWSPDGEIGRPQPQSHPLPTEPVPADKPPQRPLRSGLSRRFQYRLRLIGRQFQRRHGDVRSDIFR